MTVLGENVHTGSILPSCEEQANLSPLLVSFHASISFTVCLLQPSAVNVQGSNVVSAQISVFSCQKIGKKQVLWP